jgi:hypothetical protein
MPNQRGELNICEAAEYLGVPVRFLWSRCVALVDPPFLLGNSRADFDGAPWFAAHDLDRFRPHMDAPLRSWRKRNPR